MKSTSSVRPSLEVLEDRTCPSTVHLLGNTLVIQGDTQADLSVTQVQQGVFAVRDHGTLLQKSSVSGSLVIDAGGPFDRLVIDLNGQTTQGGIYEKLGGGTHNVVIRNGTVGGDLTVVGTSGSDRTMLGGPANGSTTPAPFAVEGTTHINLLQSGNDYLKVEPNVTLDNDLDTSKTNHMDLAAGSTVKGSVNFLGGVAANSVCVDGHIDGNFIYTGSDFYADDLAFTSSSVIKGFVSLQLSGGTNHVRFNGEVDQYFALYGIGDDTVDLNGTVGQGAKLMLGGGTDRVTFGDSLKVNGNASVDLGAGNDTFVRDAGARVGSAAIDGGAGNDTFIGSTAGWTVVNFENVRSK